MALKTSNAQRYKGSNPYKDGVGFVSLSTPRLTRLDILCEEMKLMKKLFKDALNHCGMNI